MANEYLQIERIESPSEEEFRRNYLEKSRPVVIVDKNRSLNQQKWDFEYLIRTVGHCPVPVYDWGEAGPTVHDDFKIVEMSLAEAIGHARAVNSTKTQRYSVCQLSIGRFLPTLSAEYQVPPVMRRIEALDRLPEPFSETERRALFISFFRGIHWHNGREVIAQLTSGRKKFVLYHPRDSRYLYPRKLHHSGLSWFDENEAVFCSEIPFENGIESIDRARFPLFEHATPYEVTLEAGEALYIPSHWWHYTKALEPCIVVAHFWDAPLRRWGYPIAWRSLIMKPYRKYLYRQVLDWKRKFTKQSKIEGEINI